MHKCYPSNAWRWWRGWRMRRWWWLLNFISAVLVSVYLVQGQVKPKCTPSNLFHRCYSGEGKKVQGRDFDTLDLSESNLFRFTMDRVKVKKFKMDHVDFRFGRWQNSFSPFLRWSLVDLRGASIYQVTLNNFSLQESDLRGAKISWSHFKNGDFLKSKFKDTLITDSVFENCILPEGFFEDIIAVNVVFKDCRIQK